MVHVFGKIALMTALAVIVGCKDYSVNSQVESLDNFATNLDGKIRINQCSAEGARLANNQFNATRYGNSNILIVRTDAERQQTPGAYGHTYWNDISAEDQIVLANELKITLTAVPDFAQNLFAASSGILHITKKADALCAAPFTDSRSPNYIDQSHADSIDSCWKLVERQLNGTTQRTLQLIIQADAKSIQHNLVRSFGYLYAQFYSRMVRNIGGGDAFLTRVDADQPGFKETKPRLATAFLKNKHQHNGLFPVDSLDYILGAGSGTAITTNIQSGADIYTNVSFRYPSDMNGISSEQKSLRQQRFADYVFAEAFDSFYCNSHAAFDVAAANAAKAPGDLSGQDNTQRIFRHFFTDAHGIFSNEIHPMLAQVSATLASLMQKQSPEAIRLHSEEGLNLTTTTTNNLFVAFICQLAPNLPACGQMAASGGFNTEGAPITSITDTRDQSLLTQATNSDYMNDLFGAFQAAGGSNCNCNCAGGQCNCNCGGLTGVNCSCPGGMCNCVMG